MSYQAIARKYRPQSFADLTGQEHISRTLSHALDQQRLHHAYLFSGVRGTGKTTSARLLAKGLNCHMGVTSQPCLSCPSCLEITAGNSLDVLEIDAASNTGVDNVRDVIINNLALAPARDRYKVFVIDEVHMLSNSAFNALLKTLEEPPGHVIFILATTELHKVPDTILSRCQQFEFRQIPAEKIYQRLREIAALENITISESALRELARAGAGSLRDAQSAFDQVIAFSGTQIPDADVASSLGLAGAKTLGECAAAIAAQNVPVLLDLIEQVSSRGYDLRNFTRELMAYWRHLLLVKSGITDSSVIGVADVEVTKLRELSEHFSEEDLVRGFHLLAETEKAIKDSPQPRFQLEIGLVKLAQVARLRPLAELIARLERLESSLLGAGGGAPVSNQAGQTEKGARPVKEVGSGLTGAGSLLTPTTSSGPIKNVPASFSPDEPPDFPDFDPFEEMPAEDFAAFPASRKSKAATATTSTQPVAPGQEIKAILAELKRLKRNLLTIAFEDAQVSYETGKLTFVFAGENVIAKNLRESAVLFRDIGERLFGNPLRLEVNTGSAMLAAAPESVEPVVVDEAAQTRARLHERASQNPAVRQLLDKFKGEILSVRPAASN